MNNSVANTTGAPPPAPAPSQPLPLALALAPAPPQASVQAVGAGDVSGAASSSSSSSLSSSSVSSSAAARPRGVRPLASGTLEDMLRWSVEARGDDVAARELQPMSEEDKRFLLAAMQSVQTDTTSLKTAIMLLGDPTTPADRLCTLLQGLQEMAEDSDGAVGLRNLHGLAACVALVSHANAGVQGEALLLLSLAAQNNPPVQHYLASIDVLAAIVPHLRDPADDTVHFRALSALSCLVRGHDSLVHQFLAADGPALLHASAAQAPRSAAKALYLTRCLMQQRRDFSEFLLGPALFETLFPALTTAPDEVWEQALSVLVLCPRSLLSPAHVSSLESLVVQRRTHVASLGLDADEAPQSQAALLSAVERILLSRKLPAE